MADALRVAGDAIDAALKIVDPFMRLAPIGGAIVKAFGTVVSHVQQAGDNKQTANVLLQQADAITSLKILETLSNDAHLRKDPESAKFLESLLLSLFDTVKRISHKLNKKPWRLSKISFLDVIFAWIRASKLKILNNEMKKCLTYINLLLNKSTNAKVALLLDQRCSPSGWDEAEKQDRKTLLGNMGNVDAESLNMDNLKQLDLNGGELNEVHREIEGAVVAEADFVSNNLKIKDNLNKIQNILTQSMNSMISIIANMKVPRIQFSELEFREEIGEGGESKVFKALWEGRTVAAKKKDMTTRTANFHLEVEIWAELNDPNFVRFYGICHLPLTTTFYIITDYYENGDMRDYMDANQWNLELGLKLLGQVATGMKKLHAKGIVHGDLKLKNILIKDDGTAVISDFGLSRKVFGLTEAAGHTHGWTAPEILSGELPGFKSDVFSFGMTLFEVASKGRYPAHLFEWKDHRMIAYKSQSQASMDGIIPENLWRLITNVYGAWDVKDRPTFDQINLQRERLPAFIPDVDPWKTNLGLGDTGSHKGIPAVPKLLEVATPYGTKFAVEPLQNFTDAELLRPFVVANENLMVPGEMCRVFHAELILTIDWSFPRSFADFHLNTEKKQKKWDYEKEIENIRGNTPENWLEKAMVLTHGLKGGWWKAGRKLANLLEFLGENLNSELLSLQLRLSKHAATCGDLDAGVNLAAKYFTGDKMVGGERNLELSGLYLEACFRNGSNKIDAIKASFLRNCGGQTGVPLVDDSFRKSKMPFRD